MENPQVHKKIKPFLITEHDYSDKFLYAELTASQLYILHCIRRYTVGTNPLRRIGGFPISIDFFMKKTGYSHVTIIKDIEVLIDKNVLIEVQPPTNRKARIIRPNEDISSWRVNMRSPKSKNKVKQSLPPEVKQSLPPEVKQSLPPEVKQSLPPEVKQSLPHTRSQSSEEDGFQTPKERSKEILKKKEEEEEEKEKKSSSSSPPEKVYQENIGLITPHIAERIKYVIEDGVTEELLCRYIQIATERNKRSWAYVEKMAIENLNINIKSVGDYESYLVERSKEQPKTNRQLQKEREDKVFWDWVNKDG
jgi:DnaD/phage-associated family protein